MRAIAIGTWLGLLLVGTVAWPAEPPAAPPPCALYARAQRQARLIPLAPRGERKITVDGQLDDWGDRRQDSFAIHQLLDHTLPDFHQAWNRQWEEDPADAALITLAADQEALYVAVAVADQSVVSPPGNRLGGDVVDLYLDLRPLTGNGPRLGDVKYTEGVWQIVTAPPSGGEPVHFLQPENELFTDWKPDQKAPRLGPYEVGGGVFPGGYAIELRIPLASFPDHPPADRLTQPFGFEVMIADQDAARPKGQPERLFYSCSGYSGGRDYFKSPYLFACAVPGLRAALPLSRLRPNPLRQAPGGDEGEGWMVTDLGAKDLAGAFLTACRAVPGCVPPAALGPEPFTTYPCPALGLAFHHRRVLARLPAATPSCVGNRYAAIFPAGDGPVKVDGELKDWPSFDRDAAAIWQYGDAPGCLTLPGRTDAARSQLMTARDTLYVGVRVRDDAVVNPGGAGKRFAGDCVQLFLDVRPPGGGLSSNAYADGVYHFCLAPPTDDGQPAACAPGAEKVRAPGPVEFASRRQPDGYTIELAIPVASLLAPPGRFGQPLGCELLVADVDRPGPDGRYEPLLTYSWGSFEEQTLRTDPSSFSCADYLPNRLPEIRALVDTTPVAITADFTQLLQPVSGFGGNVFGDAMPTFHTPTGVDGQYALASGSTLYLARHLDAAWIRADVDLYAWSQVRGTVAAREEGGVYDTVSPRKLATVRYPLEFLLSMTPATGVRDVYQKMGVDWHLALLKPFVHLETRLCLKVGGGPPGLYAAGSNLLPAAKWPEYAECLSSYLTYAKQYYGLEFYCLAFSPLEAPPAFNTPAEYGDFLKFLGAHFERQGLKTRFLLCDTRRFYDFRWYARLAHDPELLKYVVGVGYQSSGPFAAQLATYRLWSDLAQYLGRPLVITDFGRPYASSTTYLFDELRLWQQLTTELQAGAATIRQFVAEKSTKWPMVYGCELVADRDRGLPLIKLAPWTKNYEDVVPTMRFWFSKHFCDLTPSGHAVAVTADHPQVLVSAFTGRRGGQEMQTLHLSNAGPARRATVAGWPGTVRALRVVRSGAGAAFGEDGELAVAKGMATLDLPGWSLVSLTTAAAPARPPAPPPAAPLRPVLPVAEGPAWTNSLGLEFVPLAGLKLSFSRWETRVQDYQAFVAETRQAWPKPAFEQGPTHPAANVSWRDARAFCDWLTKKERQSGKITARQCYRLPTDAEWSVAVGLGPEPGNTPAERDGKVTDAYPWGKWPPPPQAGNYGSSEGFPPVDQYQNTAPVGSFAKNAWGLYDLGGNVWEWCEDPYEPGAEQWRVLRGGAFTYGQATIFSSAFRLTYSPIGARPDFGFRCVLAETAP